MRKLFTLICLSATCIGANAQWGHIDNGDFEAWTTDTAFMDLDDWTNSNQEMGGLANNVTAETDAVDGSLSARMETILINNDTIFGYVMLGAPGNDGPGSGIPYTSAVDSVVGYWKYNAVGNDSITILGIQTTGSNQAFLFDVKAGSQTTWQRFAYPWPVTVGQDSLMIAFASGNAMAGYSEPGSWLMVDQVQLKSGASFATDVPNYSFENWTAQVSEDPDDWYSFNSQLSALGYNAVRKITDAQAGNYALELETVYVSEYNDTVDGWLTNGDIFHILNGGGGIAYGSEPTNFEGYYKYAPAGTDGGSINVMFYNNSALVGSVNYNITSAASSYTAINESITLAQQPDSLSIAIYSGENPGSILTIDELDLTGGNVGIENYDVEAASVTLFPNPANENLNISYQMNNSSNVAIQIFNVEGKVIRTVNNNIQPEGLYNQTIDVSNLESGYYLIQVVTDNGIVAKTFTKVK